MKKITRFLMVTLVLLSGAGLTSCDKFSSWLDNPVTININLGGPEPEKTYSDVAAPLTFEATAANTNVTFKITGTDIDCKTVEYSFDGKTWTPLSSNDQHILLANVGDIVMFRGSNPTYNGNAQFVVSSASAGARGVTRAPSTKGHLANLFGNIMSMISQYGFDTKKVLGIENAGCFKNMFKDCPIDAMSGDGSKRFVMPATDIKGAPNCYEGLFSGSSVQTAPDLPAETVPVGGYKDMFSGCTDLQTVTIGATSVADGASVDDCMGGMLTDAGTNAEGGLTVEVPKEVANGSADLNVNDVTVATGAPEDTKTSYKDETGTENEVVYVTGFELEKTSLDLKIGESETLIVKIITPDNATDKTITWKTSDEEKVAVDKDGKVTALAAGKAIVTAMIGEVKAECKVTVSKKSGTVSFATAEPSQTWSATAADNTYKQTASNTGDATVTYSINENSCGATIDSSTGEVTFTKAGSVKVTASVDETDLYVYSPNAVSYTLTVKKAAGSITYTTTSVEKTTADAAFTNNTLKIVGDGEVTYSSDKVSVATVDKNGEVTIVGAGEATITATVADSDTYTYATPTATYKVTVTAAASGINYPGGYEDGGDPRTTSN